MGKIKVGYVWGKMLYCFPDLDEFEINNGVATLRRGAVTATFPASNLIVSRPRTRWAPDAPATRWKPTLKAVELDPITIRIAAKVCQGMSVENARRAVMREMHQDLTERAQTMSAEGGVR